jgi:hypothetical protein
MGVPDIMKTGARELRSYAERSWRGILRDD